MENKIEVGKIVYVRVTKEPGFVLKVGENNNDEYPFKQYALIRRPVVTDEGIMHHIDQFFLEELATRGELMEERQEDQKELTAVVAALGGTHEPDPMVN